MAAKEALNLQKSTANLTPFSDLKPLTAKYVIMYTKFARKNGMKLFWYPISFMKFYENSLTNHYPFLIKGKNILF